MLNAHGLCFLERLMNTPSPSGFEQEAQRLIRGPTLHCGAHVSPEVDDVPVKTARKHTILVQRRAEPAATGGDAIQSTQLDIPAEMVQYSHPEARMGAKHGQTIQKCSTWALPFQHHTRD